MAAITKLCNFCNKEFIILYPSWGARKFCDKQCKAKSQNGKIWGSPYKKGNITWMTGIKGRQPWMNISGLRPPKKGERVGVLTQEKNPAWKGDKVGYFALHNWVIRHKGKPSLCEHCGTTTAKRYEWANIDGKYRRRLEDFIRLCKRCHNNYDGVNVWQQPKKNVSKTFAN